ncbi:MAG: hypothetical protein PHU68_01085 [Paludibacter sp.]|nr:hypothetical protein [Paludibacter sp.]
MKVELTKEQQLNFKDYYNALVESKKADIVKFFVPKYMSIATFYYRMRTNGWTEYDYEKMEELTTLNFRSDENKICTVAE